MSVSAVDGNQHVVSGKTGPDETEKKNEPKNVDVVSSADSSPSAGSVRDRALDAIIMAGVEAKKAMRNQQHLHREAAFQSHMDAADKKDSAAGKALAGGVVAGAAGIVGGGMGLHGAAKGGKMLQKDFNVQKEMPKVDPADFKADKSTYVQAATEGGKHSGTIAESAGRVAQSGGDYASKLDDAEASRLEAQAEREKGHADDAANHAQDAGQVENKGSDAADEMRRSEHDRNVAASS